MRTTDLLASLCTFLDLDRPEVVHARTGLETLGALNRLLELVTAEHLAVDDDGVDMGSDETFESGVEVICGYRLEKRSDLILRPEGKGREHDADS